MLMGQWRSCKTSITVVHRSQHCVYSETPKWWTHWEWWLMIIGNNHGRKWPFLKVEYVALLDHHREWDSCPLQRGRPYIISRLYTCPYPPQSRSWINLTIIICCAWAKQSPQNKGVESDFSCCQHPLICMASVLQCWPLPSNQSFYRQIAVVWVIMNRIMHGPLNDQCGR